MERTIFHVDVNSAFLSWEAAYRIYHLGGRQDLRTIPSAIAGNVEMRHGIILAKSFPAKAYQIHTGMTVVEARQRCPDLYMAPPNYSLYQTCSSAFLDLLRTYTPDVEVYSIDEAFMDMTATLSLFGDAREVADQIRNRIRQELGFTVNVGISTNKVLAKMAGEMRKPDRTHTLYPDEIEEKMWPLPVSSLFYCGRASARKLNTLGIRTIGELAHTDPALLKRHLKKQGELLWAYAWGLDEAPVEPVTPEQKVYGNSTTAPCDVTEVETAYKILLALSETVASRLRRDHVQAETLSVGICDANLKRASHQMRLSNPTNLTLSIYRSACRLLAELWQEPVPLRQLGIQAGRLADEGVGYQMDLFDTTDVEKLTALDQTVDQIRRRYGNDALMRATFLTQEPGKRPIDHMEGGISREKRTVNYAEITIQ